MTGEKLRGRGLAVAAAGVVLVAWMVVSATTTEVATPHMFRAATVSAALACLCAVAAGLVAWRITDAGSAARLRYVFVVLEGAALVTFFPSRWTASDVEDAAGEFSISLTLSLTAPVLIALGLVLWLSHAVHKTVVGAHGPIVADSGEGALADRMRALGAVLVVAGGGLTISAAAVALTVPSPLAAFLFSAVLVTLGPFVLGLVLMRAKDVHWASRRSGVFSFVIVFVFAMPVGDFAFKAGAGTAVLLCALVAAAVGFQVAAFLVMREYTGELGKTWRERRQRLASR
ncbi:hypothetical protein UK23_09105 [Lentzea aerocolonigenes]|uniref:Uncharacterized protein n=1 Tax=Lentzea aerocolonigenes TaxID=68170 RepID=A0A0F0H7H0_LENAE|nr:hypothetical protein [Lentzea aerocolonigenes]KJK50816.1 hypothetical protein UK23_09105 [Lentzea aerocolonigenes]